MAAGAARAVGAQNHPASTNCAVPDTWRVVYYNSQDAVILNSVEVCDMPEVACAAPEDLMDSMERMTEVLQWVNQA